MIHQVRICFQLSFLTSVGNNENAPEWHHRKTLPPAATRTAHLMVILKAFLDNGSITPEPKIVFHQVSQAFPEEGHRGWTNAYVEWEQSQHGFALMFPSSTLNSPLSIIYLGDPISLGIMTFSETIFPSLSLEKGLLRPRASFMLHPHPPQKTYGDYFSWLNQKLDHQKRSCLNVCYLCSVVVLK